MDTKLYALTAPDSDEKLSVVTVSETRESQIRLGDLLFELDETNQQITDLNAEAAKLTARKTDLQALLLEIKITNDLSFEIAA